MAIPAARAPTGEARRKRPDGVNVKPEDESAYESDEARWRAWMDRSNRGDRAAYTQLMNEIAGVIERYLRNRFGDFDELEDCVQEALLALHCARRTYDPRRSFRAWMFAIVRHKTIDHFRRTHVRSRDRVDFDESNVTKHEAHPAHPTRALDGAKMLSNLEPSYREAIELTKFAGYTVDEAAARTGTTRAAMKSRVQRGLRMIRRQLAGEEVAP